MREPAVLCDAGSAQGGLVLGNNNTQVLLHTVDLSTSRVQYLISTALDLPIT
jgi:hypothetical protein